MKNFIKLAIGGLLVLLITDFDLCYIFPSPLATQIDCLHRFATISYNIVSVKE